MHLPTFALLTPLLVIAGGTISLYKGSKSIPVDNGFLHTPNGWDHAAGIIQFCAFGSALATLIVYAIG